MSNQGNVTVRVEENGALDWEVTFTTGRWSGNQTAKVVQDILGRRNQGGNLMVEDARDFLTELIKEDAISHPIGRLGNTDTPTVIVCFDSGPGSVVWHREHDDQVLGHWTHLEYVALDLAKSEHREEWE
jgi:hypothetical protein